MRNNEIKNLKLEINSLVMYLDLLVKKQNEENKIFSGITEKKEKEIKNLEFLIKVQQQVIDNQKDEICRLESNIATQIRGF